MNFHGPVIDLIHVLATHLTHALSTEVLCVKIVCTYIALAKLHLFCYSESLDPCSSRAFLSLLWFL